MANPGKLIQKLGACRQSPKLISRKTLPAELTLPSEQHKLGSDSDTDSDMNKVETSDMHSDTDSVGPPNSA